MRSLVAFLVLVVGLVACARPDGEQGPVSSPFGDPQAAGLAVVLTDHQVTNAMAGQLNFPSVLAYAQMIVAVFGPATDRLRSVAAVQGIAVDEGTTEAKANLKDTEVDTGNHQDDGTYLGDSVHDLTKALEIWDNTILKRVENPALRAELEATRQLIVDAIAAGMAIMSETGIPAKG
jgi:hypothetical protein